MARVPLLLVRVCLLPAIFCLSHRSIATETPSTFGGTYELTDVIKSNGNVQVTMTLTLLNPGATEVKDGIVAVMSSAPTPVRLGQFGAIESLPRAGHVTVSGTFTIAAGEYTNWQQGHAPRLEFLVPNGSTTVISSIQAHQVQRPGEVAE